MNYLDLFSGIGGFHLGLEQAGFKFDYVGFSEIDKYAKQIYQKHFPEAEDLGDVRAIDTSKLPRIDIITFGFPCQDLSIAGKRAGLAGKRSGLFDEAIRIIRDTQPSYFIFENVKGLFSSNQGRDFEYILRTVADIGYDGQWQLLNTRWVLPQNRERIYFVGYPRNKCGQKVFPIGEGNEISYGKNTTVYCLDANYYKGAAQQARTMIQIDISGKGYKSQQDIFYKTEGYMCSIPSSRTENKLNIINGKSIRRLTPTECERLQGFPDGWTEDISDTQRYKCLGNAVTVPIVKMIGDKLYPICTPA